MKLLAEPEEKLRVSTDKRDRVLIHTIKISLKEEFFDGKDICIDVKVKMVYDGRDGDIISQYVEFTKVCNGQIEVYGRTRKAIQEAVRICKGKNVLKEYLESREQEVVDMMMELYDEQEILKSYVESERFLVG